MIISGHFIDTLIIIFYIGGIPVFGLASDVFSRASTDKRPAIDKGRK